MGEGRLAKLRAELENRRSVATVEVGPPLTEEELGKLERSLDLDLPASYRRILGAIGPFSDDTGFCLEPPSRPAAEGTFEVTRAEALEFARERLAAAMELEEAGTKLFTPATAFDSVVEKRVLSYGMLGRWSDVESCGPGQLPIARLDGVAGDLYLIVRGELRGSVWFDGDAGFHPEFRADLGEIELHDTLSWALSFCRI